MSSQRGMLGLFLISVVVILLSVAGLASDFITHLLGNIDGLLLFAVCALMGGLFTLMLLMMANEEGWLPKFGHHKEAAANPGPAAKQSSAPKQPGAGN